jgi:hypothetical protein
MTIKVLKSLARQLLDQKGDHKCLGKNWHDNFIARYPDFKMLRSRALDQSCKDATNYDTAR